jgi:hypothetical protein
MQELRYFSFGMCVDEVESAERARRPRRPGTV